MRALRRTQRRIHSCRHLPTKMIPTQALRIQKRPHHQTITHCRAITGVQSRLPPYSLPSPAADDPPGFDESIDTNDILSNYDNHTLTHSRLGFNFPDPSSSTSPTSSVEAEADVDTDPDLEDDDWQGSSSFQVRAPSPTWSELGIDRIGSPSDSSLSDNPFADVHAHRQDDELSLASAS